MKPGPKDKLTTANLQRTLDTLLGVADWRKAMASIRASESLAFNWRAKSIEAARQNDTSSVFWLEWRNCFDWWHNHAGRARTENVILYESVIRDQALNGIEHVVLGPDQRPVYKENPRYIGKDDDWVMLSEGCSQGEVARYRLLLDDKGNPIPLTKIEQLPAPLRLRVLEQDRRYVERKEIDSKISGEITVAKPLQRLPGEVRPAGTMEKLKRLASMTPEQRRAELGASAFPKDATGRVAPANRGAPVAIEAKLNPPTRPSYARPSIALDRGERTGRGEAPDGGMKVV